MRFARCVFMLAGIYGIVVLTPQYFLEEQVGRDDPPAITHPEYFYGFVGVALAWQVMFVVIGLDPVRYRLAMLPAVVEKFSFAIAVAWLYARERVQALTLGFALLDGVLGMLFLTAFLRTPRSNGQAHS